ncbi:7688_t:CDS:2, partial [Paraglomus brasilianum]
KAQNYNKAPMSSCARQILCARLNYIKVARTGFNLHKQPHTSISKRPAFTGKVTRQLSPKPKLSAEVSHMSDSILLNCLVRGEAPPADCVFAVEVRNTKPVAILKDAIKRKKRPIFDSIPANRLSLWKVSLPIDSGIDEALKQLVLEHNTEKNIQKLLPVKDLSTYFPTAPVKEHIHVIIESPLALLPAPVVAPREFLHIPAKRELEFSLKPPNRQKTTGFPVNSVSNFKTLMDRGFFYADKTKYIKDIEKDQDVLMFLRPKRFGKSLLLSMLKHFYDINETPNFDRLFGSLDIYKHASELQHNKFLTLEWDFSKIQGSSSIEETNRNLTDHINRSIKRFCQTYAAILGKSNEDLQKWIVNPTNCTDSLEALFDQVRLTPYKVYLLIDEYDAITNEFLDPADILSYQQLRDKQSLMKAVFGTIKDHCSKEISRVFITGVSPLSMNDVTSGFNIRFDISLIPKYEHMLGLYEKDI